MMATAVLVLVASFGPVIANTNGVRTSDLAIGYFHLKNEDF